MKYGAGETRRFETVYKTTTYTFFRKSLKESVTSEAV